MDKRLLALLAFIAIGFSSAYAAPFSYPTGELGIEWSTISNSVIIDSDDDGLVDVIYSYSGSTPNLTLNKVMGNAGADSISVTTASGTLKAVTVSGDFIWFTVSSVSGSDCVNTGTAVNWTDGTVETSAITDTFSDGFASSTILALSFNQTGGEPLLAASCHSASGGGRIHISDTTTLLRDCASNDAFFTMLFVGCQGTGYDRTGTARSFSGFVSGLHSEYYCTDDKCPVLDGSSVVNWGDELPDTNISTDEGSLAIDPRVQIWQWGFKLPRSDGELTEPQPEWNDYFTQLANSNEYLATAHFHVLEESSSPYRFLIETPDGTTNLGLLTASDIRITGSTVGQTTPEPLTWITGNNSTIGALTEHVGTWTGTANYTNNTLAFDGSSYVALDNESNFDFDITDPFTITFWIKPITGITSNDDIFTKVGDWTGASPANRGYFAIWRDTGSGGFASFRLISDTGDIIDSSPGTIPLDTWTHTALSFSGNSDKSGMKIYINGVLNITGSNSAMTGSMLNNVAFTLGKEASTGGTTRVFDGQLDEVKIWNRELTAEEVTTVYNSGQPLSVDADFKFEDRARQYLIPDTENFALNTLATSSALTDHTYEIIKQTSVPDGSGGGPFTLFSGYQYSRDSSIFRSIDPRWSNDLTPRPFIVGPTTGLTQVNMQFRGLPTNDFAIDVQSKITAFNGLKYSWGIDELTADRILTIDLPTNLCVDILGRDIRTQGEPWIALGEICATSSDIKLITFDQNLSFTFWTLPWGTSTSYNATSDVVTTSVRNEVDPFTYNVRIYDRNGTLVIANQSTASNFESLNFNLTSVQKPARIEILDDNNQTLHFVNLGNANYFQAIQSFSAQYLSINGFNILAFMPIIFAAMWTRNTVSMGTMITVLMIMTMVWFGLFSVPDIILYFMLFVAAIGMIAYKLLF